MRPTRRVLTGLLALSAALSATACRTSGTKPDSYQPVVDRVVEAPRRQLVPIDPSLTAVPVLPPAPRPAIPHGPACSRMLGCFSSEQLESMLTTALDAYGRAADNLRAIAAASLAATTEDPAP